MLDIFGLLEWYVYNSETHYIAHRLPKGPGMPASPLTALVDRFIRADAFTGAAVVAYYRGELVLEHYAGQAR